MEERLFYTYRANKKKEEKIIPLMQIACFDKTLEKHIQSMRKTIRQVFGKELQKEEKELPLVKWKECETVPGIFSVYLLAHDRRSYETHNFFHETVSKWLSHEDPVQILSSRNLSFHVSERTNHSYYFLELLIHIEKQHQLPQIRNALPNLKREVRLAVQSPGYAKHIMEMKCLTLGSKASYVYETIVGLMNRYPKYFEHDVFRAIQHFFVHLREEFCHLRTVSHLSRLIATHYLFRKALEQDCKVYPFKRHLYFKLFKAELCYPFALKKVFGLAIVLNTLSEYECFEQRHLLKALQRIIPSIKAVPDSFYSDKDETTKLLTIYLEIEKNEEDNFTTDELKQLRKLLSHELKNSIEYLLPSLFTPRNEEELYKNIVVLSQELKFVRDLPQAIISFKEQTTDYIKFDVILLRLLKKDTPSLQIQSATLPSHARFISEKIAQVGIVRNKYPKEANVFCLEIENRPFLRKNHSVDLVRARQYVVKLIEKLTGNFRDYNGGFLFKQNEQFESIKKELKEAGKEHEFLVENLFYSLNPSILQTLIPPHIGKELVLLFLELLDVELPSKSSYLIEKKIDEEKLIIVIKIEAKEIKESLLGFLKENKVPALKLATAFLEVDGRCYACFLYLNPPLEEIEIFLNGLEGVLQAWQRKQKNLQTIRIHLPRPVPSLDPRIGADRTSGVIIKMLFEGLMRLDAEGKVENGIAEKVEVTNGGKRYTFHLRKALWSNGHPVTAYDFEYAWKKILDPLFQSSYAYLFYIIKNAHGAKKGSVPIEKVGIQAVDDTTLIVDLENPAPYFLSLTTHWTYSPLFRNIDLQHPGWAYHSSDAYACNGPFKLSLWKLNDDLELTKNSFYWDAHSVKLRKIDVRIIEDDMKALEMMKRGELCWFGDPMVKIPPRALPQFKGTPIHFGENHFGVFWLQVNVKRLPFHSMKMRQAFAYGIDRAHIANNVLHNDDIPAYSFHPNSHSHLFGDENKALALFEEGLQEMRMHRKDLPPLVFSHSDFEEHILISQEIGKQWEKLFKISVKYERVPWKNYIENLSKHNYTVGGLILYSRYDDPLYYLDLLAQKEDVTQWKNPRFEELLTWARNESNLEKRKQHAIDAENLALQEMPVIPVIFPKWHYLKNPRLKQVILSNNGQIDFRIAYLENE